MLKCEGITNSYPEQACIPFVNPHSIRNDSWIGKILFPSLEVNNHYLGP